jgi:hypothetical protein
MHNRGVSNWADYKLWVNPGIESILRKSCMKSESKIDAIGMVNNNQSFKNKQTQAQSVGWSASEIKIDGLLQTCSDQKWWTVRVRVVYHVHATVETGLLLRYAVAVIKFNSMGRQLRAQEVAAISMRPWSKDPFWRAKSRLRTRLLPSFCGVGYVKEAQGKHLTCKGMKVCSEVIVFCV